jgi:hypothetical protein
VNAGRDVERLIASWLDEEAAAGVADRVVDSIGQAVNRTPQRRLVAVRRDAMNTPLARVAGLAAVVVLGIGLVAWLGRGTIPNSGAVSLSPTLSPTFVVPSPTLSATAPTLSATPSATGILLLPRSGPFEPGTYLVNEPLALDVTLTFASEGWNLWNLAIWPGLVALYQDSPDPPGLGLVIAQTDNVYADPCSPPADQPDSPVGPTVDDLVAALVAQPQTTSTAVTDVTISGFAGKHVEIDFTSEDGCTRIWRWESDGGPREAIDGERDELWILDVDGERWIIDLFFFGTTDEADLEEARQLVEGLVIEP